MLHPFPRDQVQASMSIADKAHAVGWLSNKTQKVKSGSVLHRKSPLEIGLESLSAALCSMAKPEVTSLKPFLHESQIHTLKN